MIFLLKSAGEHIKPSTSRRELQQKTDIIKGCQSVAEIRRIMVGRTLLQNIIQSQTFALEIMANSNSLLTKIQFANEYIFMLKCSCVPPTGNDDVKTKKSGITRLPGSRNILPTATTPGNHSARWLDIGVDEERPQGSGPPILLQPLPITFLKTPSHYAFCADTDSLNTSSY